MKIYHMKQYVYIYVLHYAKELHYILQHAQRTIKYRNKLPATRTPRKPTPQSLAHDARSVVLRMRSFAQAALHPQNCTLTQIINKSSEGDSPRDSSSEPVSPRPDCLGGQRFHGSISVTSGAH